jgi:UDP-glucuronate decarboxylase
MRFDDGRVVSNFIFQALQNRSLTIYGDGTQTRSFCYVSDLVSGLILLFEKDECSGPINFGNPSPVSMTELANVVMNLTLSKSKLEMLPLPEDDPKRREPSIDRARDELGWAPLVDLDDGIKFTVANFESRLW